MPIQEECTLELVGIKRGSTTLEFGVTKPQLSLPDAMTFGADAVSEVAKAIKALSAGEQNERINIGVLEGLYDLGGILTSKKVSEVVWIARKTETNKRIQAKITPVVRDSVAKQLSSPRREKIQIDGVLDMADFKPRDQKCRIDPAIGSSVLCTFDEQLGNKIQSLLRRSVRASGIAVFQPHAVKIDALHISAIDPLPSLSLGEGNFFVSASIQELADLQKVKPVKNAAVLAGSFPDDENIDEFLNDIYNARE